LDGYARVWLFRLEQDLEKLHAFSYEGSKLIEEIRPVLDGEKGFW
jgi:hypothetical protein